MEAIVIDEGLGFMESINERLVLDMAKDQPSCSEQRFTWRGAGGSGRASCMQVRPGVDLMLVDARTDTRWSFDVLHHPTGLQFGFACSSGTRVRDERGADVGLGVAEFGLFQLNEPARLSCETVAAPEQSVRLRVDADELRRMLGDGQLPSEVDSVLSQDRPLACVTRGMTSAMFSVVGELSACTLTGPMRQLYFEGKTLELLVLAVAALQQRPCTAAAPDAATVGQLERARSILLEDLCEPPSLRELSRACGLNERKLKEGFKQRFGTTVFGFVRERRMSDAHEMLLGEKRSVTDVARHVGYSNASKFAAAFRRQFGVSPSSLASC